MFCPKCGNDSGEFKFCPYCGTKIPDEEVRTAVWSMGMACPHCGGTKLDENNCAFCGAQLMTNASVATSHDKDSFDIPYGHYGRRPTWFMLVDDCVVFTFAVWFKQHTIRVPYSRITKIAYVHPGKLHGEMIVSWEKAGDVLLSPEMKSDVGTASIVVKDKDYDVYYHLCYVLKQLAPASAELVIEVPDDESVDKGKLDDLAKVVDLDDYFEKFNPYRKQVVEAISERIGVSSSCAEVLIRQAFDQRQKELYERDPSLAIRDLNRAIQERNRRKEIREQERKETQYRASNRYRR